MDEINYGPLRFLVGTWESQGLTGENQAPDPDRKIENTKFRQVMIFEPIGDVENHEQLLYALRYHSKAWEEGEDDPDSKPFHEEVGYFIWDKANRQIMKSFIVPRGVVVNAGGDAEINDTEIQVSAILGSTTYGICSNRFLDEEFQTIRYDLKIELLDEETFSYEENTQLKIKGQAKIFDHTEKNKLKKVSSFLN